MAFYWDKADAWYEEDDEVFKHARDPYHRVDVLSSSRHVEVRVNGVLQNMPEFQKAFGCQAGQPMVSANSCRIW